MGLVENFRKIQRDIPKNVIIVAATKQRAPDEVLQLMDIGLTQIGENYVQEAEMKHQALGHRAKELSWHMIGELQTNKINKALKIFDVIQTVDSIEKAEAINKRIAASDTGIKCIYLEINVGGELSKSGLKPDQENILNLVNHVARLKNISLEGMMTMGPTVTNPEALRPFFRQVKTLYDYINKQNISNVQLKTLSMGMSDSYRIAIEEGANMIRLGTAIFGARKY